MKTYLEWLNEFTFTAGRDQDYTADPYSILAFSPTAHKDYELEGKTHGAMSHAIKHLIEFEPEFVSKVVQNAKKTLIDMLTKHPRYFCKIWSTSGGYSKEEGIAAVKKANQGTILNTIDMYNDKNMLKSGMIKMESCLKSFAEMLKDKYTEIIQNKVKKAYNLNKTAKHGKDLMRLVQKNPLVIFTVNGMNGKSYDVLIDFTDKSLVIGRDNLQTVNTFYKMDNANSKSAFIDGLYKRHLIPANSELADVLKEL